MRPVRSLQTRLLFVIIPLIVIPLFLNTAFTYRVYTEQQETESRSFMNNVLNKVSSNLDRYTKDLNRLTLMPSFNNEILDILRKRADASPEQSDFVTFEENLAMSRFHASLLMERKEICGYALLCGNGKIFIRSETDTRDRWSAQEQQWVDEAARYSGSLVFLEPNTPSYYVNMRESVLSVARQIVDPDTFRPIATVKIDLYLQGFRDIFYEDDASEMLFYIFNSEQKLIYPSDMKRAFINLGGSDRIQIDGREYLMAVKTSEESGLTTYIFYPYDLQRRGVERITARMLLVSALALAVACLLAILLSRRLVRPIKALEKKMESLQSDLSVRAEVTSHDEIGSLTVGFNTMAERLNRLINERYLVKIREKEAEMLVLQSQLNPHFLYNALETVSMTAVSHNDIETSDAVATLGKMMRYTISRHGNLVRLRQEIRFVENYLAFQTMRLGDMLTFEIEPDADMEQCVVPKLILQPFVENVISHAIRDKPVRVRLKAMRQWGDLIIIISDDGAGIGRERRKQIEHDMYAKNLPRQDDSTAQNGGGIALRNVHQRIRLMYGEPYGVSIDSRPDCGSAFFIRLPLILKQEERHEEDIAGRG